MKLSAGIFVFSAISLQSPGIVEEKQNALLIPSPTINLSPAKLPSVSRYRDLYEGIVIDQTVTRNGQEFYRFFVSSWRDKPLSDRYTVSVKEQPSVRFGSQIFISYGTRRVFQGQISTNKIQVKSLSDTAVEIAYEAVTEGEMKRLLFKDLDVGQDEI